MYMTKAMQGERETVGHSKPERRKGANSHWHHCCCGSKPPKPQKVYGTVALNGCIHPLKGTMDCSGSQKCLIEGGGVSWAYFVCVASLNGILLLYQKGGLVLANIFVLRSFQTHLSWQDCHIP